MAEPRTPCCYSYSCYNAQRSSDISIDADGLPLNLLWADRLSLIDAGVGGSGVLSCHLPERILDNDWGVMFIAHHFLEAACRY